MAVEPPEGEIEHRMGVAERLVGRALGGHRVVDHGQRGGNGLRSAGMPLSVFYCDPDRNFFDRIFFFEKIGNLSENLRRYIC